MDLMGGAWHRAHRRRPGRVDGRRILIAVVVALVAGCTAPGSPFSAAASRGESAPSSSTTRSAPPRPSPAESRRRDPAATNRGLPAGVVGPYAVVDVVDGDTVRIVRSGHAVTVRLLGIDTPETKDPRRPVECFGREASARATRLLAGRSVYLEFDPSQGHLDKYGRTLAYVWLPDQRPVLVNERMIGDGFAFEYTYHLPYRYQARFRAAEADARRHSRGLWSPTSCGGDPERPAASGWNRSTDETPGDRYYASCSAARAAGAVPLRRGEPGYRPGLDGDDDGVACE